MWIKDKSVKPKIDSLVVVVMPLDGDIHDYQVALFQYGLNCDGVEEEVFVLWDRVGSILTIDEIEAYTPLQEYNRRKGL